MPLYPEFPELSLRVLLTLLAAGAIGFERGRAGKAAGLRTTVLVALAACLTMILVNLLLPVHGKAADSFIQVDPMRLPLGLLTGVGFIGAGTILKRGSVVVGVTTAASMWFVTVIGLVFGAGEFVLGIAGSLLGIAAIELLQFVEMRIARRRQAILTMRFDRRVLAGDDVQGLLARAPFALVRVSYSINTETQLEDRVFHLRWTSHEGELGIPQVVQTIAALAGVVSVHWEGGGIADD